MTLVTRGLLSSGPVLLVTRGLSPGTAGPTPSPNTILKAVLARLVGDSTVAALVGDRIDAGAIPQAETLPAVGYAMLSNIRDHTLTGAAGVARARVQLEIRSHLATDFEDVSEAVRNLFDGKTWIEGTVRVRFTRSDGEWSGYDEPDDGSDDGTHWKYLTYTFTYLESVP